MTRVQQFVLLGFPTRLGIRDALFAVFLTLYLLTLLENTLIISLICSHSELHKPMYFFLGNLSCLEICMTQLFFFVSLICTECTLLASMAYDRYVAICRPLHYPLLMRPQVCLGLALSSWLGGLVVSAINHFFCDVSPLLNLSCTHVALTELVDFISAIVILWGCFLMTMASYVAIGRAVVCMPSITARYKAFSTCASHLVVVGIFYSVTIFIYARPKRIEDMDLNKMLSVIYTVVTPMCNPVIYCLRNKEVQVAFYKTMHWS
ncbi:Olfactory receptor 5 [Lemmus lemmus]